MNFLSVLIITLNEEKNIARCIDSVEHIADEVIVLDCYSTDNTVEIARHNVPIIPAADLNCLPNRPQTTNAASGSIGISKMFSTEFNFEC